MFGFIRTIFVSEMMFFSFNALKCISMNNEECRIRPKLMKVINSN